MPSIRGIERKFDQELYKKRRFVPHKVQDKKYDAEHNIITEEDQERWKQDFIKNWNKTTSKLKGGQA